MFRTADSMHYAVCSMQCSIIPLRTQPERRSEVEGFVRALALKSTLTDRHKRPIQ